MNKPLRDYKAYTFEDLFNDQAFIIWVLQPDATTDGYWKNIQQRYPRLNTIIPEAKQIILSLQFETDHFSSGDQQRVWKNIEIGANSANTRKNTRTLWYKYAGAAVIAGILCFVGIFYAMNKTVSIETPYGQVRNITLPDGSVITLNANSTIKYGKNWDQNEIREVWVTGEAFLKVNHLHQTGPVKTHDRFVVHTGGVDVDVLGTSFNVNDRRNHTEVALLDGQVRLLAGKNQPLLLAPGDIAEYAGGKLVKKPINVVEYTSWKDGKLYFRNVPLTKIFDYFEDIYGYKVVVDNPAVLEKRLSGTLNSRDKKILFAAIARTLNLSIKANEDTRELIVTSN